MVITSIVLSTVCCVAFLVADATTTLLGSHAPRTNPSPMSHRAERLAYDGCRIIERNIFDPAINPPCDAAPEPEPPPVAGGEVVPTRSACEGPLRLVGTAVFAGRPGRSLAAIAVGAGVARTYRPGMLVDRHRLVTVGYGGVDLAREGSHACALLLRPSRDASPPAPTSRPSDVEGPLPSVGIADIRPISPTRFRVSRTLRERILADPLTASGAVRVVPGARGPRLYGVRRGSLPDRLGLENGDAVRTINGYDVSDLDGLLGALPQLSEASTLTVAVERGGRPVALDYVVE